MTQELVNKQILITIVLLTIALVFFQVTDVDIKISDMFYNFDTNTWIWNKHEPISKFIFYVGIKKVLKAFAVILLLSLIFFRKTKFIQEYKKGIQIVVLSAIIVPMTVIGLKNTTNTPCPKHITHFGGTYPDVNVFDSYPKDFKQEKRIRCWPAGHASGGFALMSIFFLFKKRKNQYLAVAFACCLGWAMGLYKMLIGDHYLSHTIISMLIAWLLILFISKFVERINREKSAKV